MKILYVEDNAVNLSLIQRIAQMNQHELISLDTAEGALKELDDGLEIDIILLDIQLAGEMDGIGFAKAARAKGIKTPIIAITAYAMRGDKERILEAGCNDYLPKPLPIAEFLQLLAKYDPSVYKPDDDTTEEKPDDNTAKADEKAEDKKAEDKKTDDKKAEDKKANDTVKTKTSTPHSNVSEKPSSSADTASKPDETEDPKDPNASTLRLKDLAPDTVRATKIGEKKLSESSEDQPKP